MLAPVDAEFIAFEFEGGEPYCRPCMIAKVGELRVARIESGLSDEAEPLTRYTMVETMVERSYEWAEEALEQHDRDFPRLETLSDGLRHKLLGRIAFRMEEPERCVECECALL